MTRQLERFQADLAGHGRQRVAVEALWEYFDRVFPEYRDDPNRRARLVAVLEQCVAAGTVRFPAGKSGWTGSGGGRLPRWVQKPSRPRTADDGLSKSISWLPGLEFGSTLRGPQREDLERINAFLIARGDGLQPVPFRERSLEIFGDEHYWDRGKRLDPERETLFQGRLPLAVVGAFVVPEPLAYETPDVAEDLCGRPVLAVENHHSYFSLVQWNQRTCRYAAVCYGQGNAVWSKVRALSGLATRSGGVAVEYLGDIDRGGLWIAHVLSQKAARTAGTTVRPALPFYRWLLDHGHVRADPKASETRDWPSALGWLEGDPYLRDRVAELLSAGMRIAQEALGAQALSSDAGGLLAGGPAPGTNTSA